VAAAASVAVVAAPDQVGNRDEKGRKESRRRRNLKDAQPIWAVAELMFGCAG
jgi:hypothetical protein